jgi:hypothetical protein
MREFAESVEPERLSDELQNAIRGAGAFRYFKDTLRRYRREKDWYAYREEALRQIRHRMVRGERHRVHRELKAKS